MEYELYNFWHFEFGIRAFSSFEDVQRHKEELCFFVEHLCEFVNFPAGISANVHKEKYSEEKAMSYFNSYGDKIKFLFNNYHNKEFLNTILINKSKAKYSQFIKIYTRLADTAFKYGIYPHQLLFPKSFHERCAYALENNINTNYLIKTIQLEVDDYDFSENFNKKKIEHFLATEEYKKDFFNLFFETPLIDYSSKESFYYFINNMKTYKKNLSFTTSKNPFHRKYPEGVPVQFERMNGFSQEKLKIEANHKYCYVEIVEKMDSSELAEKICKDISDEESNNILDYLQSPINEEAHIVRISIDLSYKNMKRIKKHIESVLTIIKQRKLYNSPLRISKLYFLVPQILAEKKEEEIEQNILKNYSIETLTNYKEELDLECQFIDCIHTLVNGHNKQLSYFRNSIGMFIWDMHHFYKVGLGQIYDIFTQGDDLTEAILGELTKNKKNKGKMPKINEEILKCFEPIRNAWQRYSLKEPELEEEKKWQLHDPKKAYEQVYRLIKYHCNHPLYK